MLPEDSLYSLLSVPENASSEEIKRAFYRAVRRDRLHEDAARFKHFRTAFDVLTDPLRRREYDQLRQHGPQVEALIVEAQTYGSNDSNRALRLLKRAVVLAPDVPLPRLLLADQFSRDRDYDSAAAEYRRLIARTPDDGGLRLQFARTLLLAGRQEDARDQADLLLEKQPAYFDALLLRAEIATAGDDRAEAAAYLNRAIALAGESQRAAFEPLLRLFLLLLRSGQADAADDAAEKLRKSIQDEDDGWRAAVRLQEAALEFEESDQLEAAERVLDVLDTLDVPEGELRIAATHLRDRLALAAERGRLESDSAVTDSCRRHLLRNFEDREAPDIFLVRMEGVIAGNPAKFRAMLAHLREQYPHLSREHAELLLQADTVVERWSSRFRVPVEKEPALPHSAPGRWLTALFAAAGLLAGLLLMEWRAFAGFLARLFGR